MITTDRKAELVSALIKFAILAALFLAGFALNYIESTIGY